MVDDVLAAIYAVIVIGDITYRRICHAKFDDYSSCWFTFRLAQIFSDVSRISAMSSRREAIGGVDWDYHWVLIWATAAVLGLAIIFATMPIIQGMRDDAWWSVFSLSRH